MIQEKDFTAKIGEIVEEHRKASGMTRQQIGDVFDTNQAYIYAIEKTGAKLPLFRFFQLLQIFPANVSKKMLEESLKLIDFPQEITDRHAERMLQQIQDILNGNVSKEYIDDSYILNDVG